MSQNYNQFQNMNNPSLVKGTPFTIEQIFEQVCEYKVFLVNLKRAVLLGNQNFITKVCLINSDWFQRWKKISCYEAIKDELSMFDDVTTNYQKNIDNYRKIMQNLNITETIDVNIQNNLIDREVKDDVVGISPKANFDIISPKLWESFNFNTTQNVNNGTMIDLDINYLTNDSLEIKLGKNSRYIIFWNFNDQRLEKIILTFKDEGQLYLAFENLKNLGINNFYASYLDDLVDYKIVRTATFSLVCINKSDFKKNVIKLVNTHSNNPPTNNNYIPQNNYEPNIQNPTGPMGLKNIFLTCYMNSALQSLVNVQKLSNYFTQNENIINNSNQPLSHAYLNVVKNLLRLTPESQNLTYYSPNEFFNATYSLDPLFRSPAGDAIDLINFFLQRIHSELNGLTTEDVFCKYLMSNFGTSVKWANLNTAINSFVQSNKSIITNVFYFIEKSKLTCQNCGNVTYNFQFLNQLIFPLEDIRIYKSQICGSMQNYINIMDGFDHYKRQISLTGENVIYCNACNCQTNAFQYNAMFSSPDYLLINLNRGKNKSLNVYVNILEQINIANYVETQVDNCNFRLISIITHLGQSGTSGHFIAYCFVERENSWFQFNDSLVTRSSFQEASSSGDSYVLIYQRM